ncbi:MAG: redoxin domain-containing protein [Pseudomonadota bacterium]|nr:redoxin domain-containing protein [Pseudomonadota bacterium]
MSVETLNVLISSRTRWPNGGIQAAMNRKPIRLRQIAVAAVMMIALQSWCSTVENFSLLDQNGAPHELHGYASSKAVVLMVQGNGCPIVRNALSDIKAVRDRYAPKNITFLMINSNLQDDVAAIREESRTWNIDFAVLDDEEQGVGEALGITRTAEVLVIDTNTWDLVYRGPVNDRLTYEGQKATADRHYVAEALDAILNGLRPEFDRVGAKGCLINFPARRRHLHDVSSIDTRNAVAPSTR